MIRFSARHGVNSLRICSPRVACQSLVTQGATIVPMRLFYALLETLASGRRLHSIICHVASINETKASLEAFK